MLSRSSCIIQRSLAARIPLCLTSPFGRDRLEARRNVSTSKGLVPHSPDSSASRRFPRTHYCGSLDLGHEGERVHVSGWIQWMRFKNFLVLRDVKGLVQVCFDEDFLNDPAKASLVANLKQESVVRVSGTVRRRPKGQANPKMPTGEIEIKCDELELLSSARPKLPFEITDFNRPGESSRLKYRYLDLRLDSFVSYFTFYKLYLKVVSLSKKKISSTPTQPDRSLSTRSQSPRTLERTKLHRHRNANSIPTHPGRCTRIHRANKQVRSILLSHAKPATIQATSYDCRIRQVESNLNTPNSNQNECIVFCLDIIKSRDATGTRRPG